MAWSIPYILELFEKLIFHNDIPTDKQDLVTQTHTKMSNWTKPSLRMGEHQNWFHASYCLSASLSLVTLPEVCGLGAEGHGFYSAQDKNTKFVNVLPNHGHVANCFQIKAKMHVCYSDCKEQNRTSSSKTPFCLPQGRGEKKKEKENNFLTVRKSQNTLYTVS